MAEIKGMFGQQPWHQLDPCKGSKDFGLYQIRSYFGSRGTFPMTWFRLLTKEDEYPWQAGRMAWRRDRKLGTKYTKIDALRVIAKLDAGAFRFAVEKEKNFKERLATDQPWHPYFWLGRRSALWEEQDDTAIQN
ncbi:MAG: hypothetical protein K8953_00220 [Proteobacteria bacterium]|nr:hypothetical protein [Pseudomonadota bacterium]